MDASVWLVLIIGILLGVLLWIYDHPPKNSGKRSGRGGDFDE